MQHTIVKVVYMGMSKYSAAGFLLYLCSHSQLRAQGDYSREAFVVESNSTEFSFENDGTSVRKAAVRVRIQSDAGVQRFAVITFAYQGSTEKLEVDSVRVIKPDGTVVATPPDNGQDLAAAITQQAPLFSDLREKRIAVKGLGVGDALEYEAHWRVTQPLAPGQFWTSFNFATDGIIRHETFQVSVPRERAVKWKSPKGQPAITEAGARRVYKWTGTRLEQPSKEQQERDADMALYQARRGLLPQPEIELSTFQNWDEVGRWYGNLQKDRVKVTPEIRAKAAELTAGLTDEGAKARAIYRYVTSQIHYVGIDFGIGRYQPHYAAEVLANQYGDCKDKHTLLAALLAAAGMQAVPALVNTTRELDLDVPSPAQFDHVITSVRSGNQAIWLDATPDVARFAYLIGPLRGKKALLVAPDAESALADTPTDPPVKAVETFRMDAKLNDAGILEGKVERTIQGSDGELLTRTVFRSMPLPQWKDLAQRISSGSGFAGDVSEVDVSAPEKNEEPFRIAYKYKRADYPGWPDRRVGAPLPPMVPPIGEKEVKPIHPVTLGAPAEYVYESYIELPKGYRPVLPKSFDLNEKFADYHSSSRIKDGVWITKRRLVVRGEVPVTQYGDYRIFNKTVTEDYDRKVALTSGAASPDLYQSEIWELPGSAVGDAVRYYDDARDRAGKGDMPAAIGSIKRALEADPKFTRAWVLLGEMYKATGQMDQAVVAYRKAIEIDSPQPVSYKALGFTLLSMKRPEDAIPVWRQLIQVSPGDVVGPTGLGNSMLALKRYPEAQSAFETAAQIDPESARVQLQLGSTYQHTGKHEASMAAYRKGLELDPRPLMYSDVAYELATANADLPAALEYAKKAANEEALATHEIKLAQLRGEDLGGVRTLATVWDTLGWVYFQMGHVDQAEKYLNAAWTLSQRGIVGNHLAQTYEARNKNQAAIRMYRFALSCTPKTFTEERDKINERLSRLASGTSPEDFRAEMDAAGEVSRLRTIPLTRVAPGEAHADFFLIFRQDSTTSKATVEAAKFISGSETLKSAAELLKTTDFKAQLPPDGDPRVLRRGMLVCEPVTGCSITLLNPDDVLSVD